MRVLGFIIIAFTSSLAQEYSECNIHFSANVYMELTKIKSGNFLVCPVSAQTVLSLLTLGARGNTAKELSIGLSLPDDFRKIREMFYKLSSKFEVKQPYTLTSLNKIYLAERFTIKKDYKDIALNIFKSDVQTINFNNNEIAANEINAWIKSKTYNKITDVVKKDTLSSLTSAVLVNAMYFHGFWLEEFGSSNDFKAPFYITPLEILNVDVFGGRSYYNYYENKQLNAKFLELPFVGNEVSMTYVLPKEKMGLILLEKNILELLVEQPLKKLDVIVQLPKLKLDTDIDLKTILKSLGVIEAFTSSANFQAISDAPIEVSYVLQKAFIEINERGATSIAATKSAMIYTSMPQETFIVEHPFIFFLKHKSYGVLFVGRCTNPLNS